MRSVLPYLKKSSAVYAVEKVRTICIYLHTYLDLKIYKYVYLFIYQLICYFFLQFYVF